MRFRPCSAPTLWETYTCAYDLLVLDALGALRIDEGCGILGFGNIAVISCSRALLSSRRYCFGDSMKRGFCRDASVLRFWRESIHDVMTNCFNLLQLGSIANSLPNKSVWSKSKYLMLDVLTLHSLLLLHLTSRMTSSPFLSIRERKSSCRRSIPSKQIDKIFEPLFNSLIESGLKEQFPK